MLLSFLKSSKYEKIKKKKDFKDCIHLIKYFYERKKIKINQLDIFVPFDFSKLENHFIKIIQYIIDIVNGFKSKKKKEYNNKCELDDNKDETIIKANNVKIFYYQNPVNVFLLESFTKFK